MDVSRLKDLYEKSADKYAEAKAIGTTYQTMYNIIYKGSLCKVDLLQRIAKYYRKPIGYFFGEDEQKDIVDVEGTGGIPLLPVKAQGGSLNEFVASPMLHECERIVCPIGGVDFAMTISGESMYPEYPNGSQIFVKKVNEKAFIEWGKCYVLDTCNGAVIKILVPGADESKVKCLSVNKDERYAPFEVAWKDVFGVYRVVLCMQVK